MSDVLHSSWTADALESVEQLRGWTAEAIAALGLRFERGSGRVSFDVRDETGTLVGCLHYRADSARSRGEPKMLADSGSLRQLFPPPEMLPDDRETSTVWLLEGEPDAVRAWSLGLTGIAVPGAANWRPEWASRFRGRRWRVIVCFDCDEVGRSGAARVAADLAACGVDVHVVDLDKARADGYDFSDFVQAATTPELREQAAAMLLEVAERTPLFSSPTARPLVEATVRETVLMGTHRRTLADVEPRQVRWLVPGLIARGTLNLCAGEGGLGKSTYLMGLAAMTTTGELLGEPADAIVVSFEDTAAEILRPRIEAASGDLTRVHEVYVPLEEAGPLTLPRDLRGLAAQLEETRAKLLIIDPIVAAMDVAFDAHKDQHVRVVLAELVAMAERFDVAIVIVGHLNKAASRDAYIRISNSVAFYNAARSVVLVTADPEEPEQHRLVSQVKANWSRLRPVQRWVLEEIQLERVDAGSGERIVTSRMRYVENAEDIDRSDLLAGRLGSSGGNEKLAVALGWLLDQLGDGEWHDSSGLKAEAAALGIKERTLRRAAAELGVEHQRSGFPSASRWRLNSQARLPLPGMA